MRSTFRANFIIRLFSVFVCVFSCYDFELVTLIKLETKFGSVDLDLTAIAWMRYQYVNSSIIQIVHVY